MAAATAAAIRFILLRMRMSFLLVLVARLEGSWLRIVCASLIYLSLSLSLDTVFLFLFSFDLPLSTPCLLYQMDGEYCPVRKTVSCLDQLDLALAYTSSRSVESMSHYHFPALLSLLVFAITWPSSYFT